MDATLARAPFCWSVHRYLPNCPLVRFWPPEILYYPRKKRPNWTNLFVTGYYISISTACSFVPESARWRYGQHGVRHRLSKR